jgi:hypothetical protein
MIFSADGNWTLPTGMVWVKHFDLPLDRANPAGPRRRLETRFLVKTADGTYGLTYKWRDDGTEADLVGEDGEDAFYQVQSNGQTVTQRWHYPARYECLECHTAVGGHALSFNTPQMNRSHPYGAQTPNQIKALSDAGYFTAPVTGVNNLRALASRTTPHRASNGGCVPTSWRTACSAISPAARASRCGTRALRPARTMPTSSTAC